MTKTYIMNIPSCNVSQMQEWAISKKATQTFIENAILYFEICSKVGVNPAVAYVQYAEETGYGKYGGLVPANYCNPCGLKASSKNGDTTADFKKFDNWKQGIWAHIDHLALYAGAQGYPKDITNDPRHFPSLKGKCPTVESLSGNWASSKTYHERLLTKKKELEYDGTQKISQEAYNKATKDLEAKNK